MYMAIIVKCFLCYDSINKTCWLLGTSYCFTSNSDYKAIQKKLDNKSKHAWGKYCNSAAEWSLAQIPVRL